MGSKSTKQTTNQQFSQTSTPNNPSWVTQSLQDLNSRIGQIGQADPGNYVAPASILQNQAFDGASKLGDGQAGYGAAAGLVGQGTGGPNLNSGGASILDNGGLAKYINPYIGSVLGAANHDADQNDLRTMGALKAQAAGSGAFGDSTYGIAQGQAVGELARARQSTNAGLLDRAYTQALGADQFDTSNRQQSDLANQGASEAASNRALSGAGLLSGITSAYGADQRANVGTQAGLGETQRGIDANQRTAPISLAQALASLYGQNQFGLFQGQTSNGTSSGTTTQTQNPGLLAQIGQGAQVAGSLASLFSDVRLKRELRQIEPDAKGRRRFAWRYLWGQTGEGYLAQDLLRTDPHAVSVGPGGFLVVDHVKLEGAQWAS